MKCDQFRDALRAIHAWDRPDDELPSVLRQHANGCIACSDEWDRVDRLKAALGAIAHESSLSAPPQLEGRLLETFRAHRRESVRVSQESSGAFAWLPMAAGIVLAVGAASWFAVRPAPPSPTVAARAAGSPQPAVSAGQSGGSSPQVAAASPIHATPARRGATDTQQTASAAVQEPAAHADASVAEPIDRESDETVADFVSLPYGAMPTDDDVHVVQIDVPRDSLYDFGSAVQSSAAANDLVTADVVIGDDGAPRAFRIVEPATAPVALERQQNPFGTRSPRP